MLATYNGLAHLPVQLASLEGQSRPPDELVICDDGSTDGTRAFLREFGARTRLNVSLIENEKNLGYAGNFANGAARAKGELIFFCDQDDRWYPEKIATYVARFEQEPALQALFSDSNLVDHELRPLGSSLFVTNRLSSEELAWIHGGEAWRAFLRHSVVAGNTLAFRRAAVLPLLPVPAGWVHDAWIATSLALRGQRIDALEESFLDYRQHGGQNIGVVGGNFFTRLRARWQRAKRAGLLEAEVARWRQLNVSPLAPEVKAALAEKISWLEGRSRLSAFRPARLPFLLKNISRYRRFENGWQTWLRDLLT